MQYILTEAEYRELKREQDVKLKLKLKELQDFCTLAAMHIPIKRSWSPNDTIPWGCILAPANEKNSGYCDECPAQKLCPYDGKEWSQ